jgi:EAL domain-containing protein (putative c-di-GMP-specific phosphodiesterase class I)
MLFMDQRCAGCRDGEELGFELAMAFQPIVDVTTGAVYAYEALVRGLGGESAASVLGQVTDANRYAFDQQCRVKAIETATRAGLLDGSARLSINFLPNAVYSPNAFPTDRLIFEFTENEKMADPGHVAHIIATYQAMGFGTALDDFGAGHAGLGLLARFQPDAIKLDMELIRGLDSSLPRRLIVAGVVRLADELGITVIAEGIETEAELAALRAIGVRYIQGYLLARPEFQTLPRVTFPVGDPFAAAA